MASSSKMEIDKFNRQSFELWKLKMKDLLVDKDQWIHVLHLHELQQMTGKSWIGR
jgi:hypothetical protein